MNCLQMNKFYDKTPKIFYYNLDSIFVTSKKSWEHAKWSAIQSKSIIHFQKINKYKLGKQRKEKGNELGKGMETMEH